MFIGLEIQATGIQFRLDCLEQQTSGNAAIPALLTGQNQVSSSRSHPVTGSLSKNPHILAVVDFTCDPTTDPAGCLPPGCEQGDPKCDPGCGKNYCCLLERGEINPDGTPIETPPRSDVPSINGNR